MNTFYIETFGCQMNKGDSELIKLSMIENGFSLAESEEAADICIFNTCSVRDHAEKRALAKISIARSRKAAKRRLIVVAGCMAQRIGEALIQKGNADLVAGPYQSPLLGDIIKSHIEKEINGIFLSQAEEDFAERINFNLVKNKDVYPWHKWVTITHGCENFCAYCIVPYVRGKLISFPSEKILNYIRNLSSEGIIEITLLGQNVNQYGQDCGEIPFYRLLEKTAAIKGLKKINFLTSHPMDFNSAIADVIKDNSNISRSIHLPLQSGSDPILKAMNRKYTLSDYYRIIETLNKKLDNFSVSTDLIVGFPGETEEDFRNTLKAVTDIRYDEAFMYAYSPREGTPAFSIKEELTRSEKIERLNELITLQRKISLEKLKTRINRIETVIAEKLSRKSSDEVSGKTFLNHPVVFTGSRADIGKETRVEIIEVSGSTLIGKKIL
ncbi:MAG TPA: tRNA (N6-isopentenyl adenosine(37)-C2)-methylthiotransferase MiaB [Spirochaetota bacterium]|nr:tRNA (N6-isopentenyl adenosine(37)-C2)-methylthiotransferase MiaB [Spirochaetota bacterium]